MIIQSPNILHFDRLLPLLSTLLFFALPFVSTSSDPTLVVRVSDKALRHLNKRAISALEDSYDELRFKRIESELGAKGTFIIDDLRIHHFEKPDETNIRLKGDDRIFYEVRGVDLGANGDLSGIVRVVVPLKLRGRGYLDLEDVSITVESRLRRTPKGLPEMEMRSCKTRIGKIAFRIEDGGSLTKLAKTFKGVVSKFAKPILQKELCNIFEQYAIKQLNEMLITMPTGSAKEFKPHSSEDTKLIGGFDIGDLFNKLSITYKLPEDPSVHEKYVKLSAIAHIKTSSRSSPPKFSHVDDFGRRQMRKADDRMLNVWLGEQVPNEILYHAYRQKRLNIELDKNNKDFGSALSGNCIFGCITDIVPEILEDYENADLAIVVSFNRPPKLAMDKKMHMTLDGTANIKLYGIKPSTRRKTLILYMNATAKATMKDIELEHDRDDQLWLKADVRVTSLRIMVKQSRVRGITTGDRLSEAADWVSLMIDSQISELMKKGVPVLNGDYVQLKRTKVSIGDHNVHLSTDLDVKEKLFVKQFKRLAKENS